MFCNDLKRATEYCARALINSGQLVPAEKWQSIEHKVDMLEALFISFRAPMPDSVVNLLNLIKPNYVWAEAHFEERVSGVPLNPGETYKIWPYYKRDKEMRNWDEKFSHTYMERYWPKYAWDKVNMPLNKINRGIRFEYGDLLDVVRLLREEPTTRQAYLPIWFPEDTGNVNNVRVPCTLGYHFILRGGHLHINYFMRSCDYFRHFRDDVYLTVRLAQWMQAQLGIPKLGYIKMDITSLHIFYSERNLLK